MHNAIDLIPFGKIVIFEISDVPSGINTAIISKIIMRIENIKRDFTAGSLTFLR